MQRFIYILPTNFEHKGISKKVDGQIAFLRRQFNVTLIANNFKSQSFFLQKLWAYIIFELSAIFHCFSADIIYIRYNTKSVCINFWLIFLSYFKPVYVEHNNIIDTELFIRRRFIEHRFYLMTLYLMRWGQFTHVAVNNELKSYLEIKNLKQVVYAQNGYDYHPIETASLPLALVDQVRAFKEKFSYLAIFCGNGYAWHGVDDIVKLLASKTDVGLLIVGPYTLQDSDQYLQFDNLDTNSISYLIEQCDFSISSFRLDMINISEGSLLKSRQYLCHGCPVLVNYYDCASDFDALKPFIIDYRDHQDDWYDKITSLGDSKNELRRLACQYLNWDNYFNQFL